MTKTLQTWTPLLATMFAAHAAAGCAVAPDAEDVAEAPLPATAEAVAAVPAADGESLAAGGLPDHCYANLLAACSTACGSKA